MKSLKLVSLLLLLVMVEGQWGKWLCERAEDTHNDMSRLATLMCIHDVNLQSVNIYYSANPGREELDNFAVSLYNWRHPVSNIRPSQLLQFSPKDELGVNFSTPSYENTNNSDKEVKKLSRFWENFYYGECPEGYCWRDLGKIGPPEAWTPVGLDDALLRNLVKAILPFIPIVVYCYFDIFY